MTRRRSGWLGGLGVVAAFLLYATTSSPRIRRPPSLHPRPTAAAPLNDTAPPPLPQRGLTARRATGEFRPRLRSNRPEDRVDPTKIDPTLRLDLLAKVQNVPLEGGSRNLFTFGAAPLPPDTKPLPNPSAKLSSTESNLPTRLHRRPDLRRPRRPPPIPLKYYGYTNARGETRKKAFFLNGEDIIVAWEGDTVMSRPLSHCPRRHQLRRNGRYAIEEQANHPARRRGPRMKRSSNESGFALLLVFAMASIIAITLFYALPRASFEAQRDKEQLLIDRGEQYTRAIQLYVRKFKRFPAKMEDLENTNGVRFLRRQYIDPMTGKSEWRHPPRRSRRHHYRLPCSRSKDKKDDKPVDNFIADLGGFNGPSTGTDTPANLALRHRPSDQAGAPGGAGGQPNLGPIPPDPGLSATPPAPSVPIAPGSLPPAPTTAAATTGGGVSVFSAFGGATTTPVGPTQLPGAVAQQINNPGQGVPGGLVPGATNQGTNQTDASRLIQNLLTSPRPGGLPGLQGGTQQAGAQTIGGGIAGVASKFKGTAIKIYNDQDEFPKWEFVYDISKDKSMNPAAGANIPATPPPPGTPIGAAPANPVPATPTIGVPIHQPPQ